jgi:hypothetical protein
MGEFSKELLTLQTWLKTIANLGSYREGVKAGNARPVVALEAPSNIGTRQLTTYQEAYTKRQYCRLYVNNLDEALEIQEKLTFNLVEKRGRMAIMEDGVKVGTLREVKVNFQQGEGLVVPFDIEYEVTYGRTKPQPAPHATTVITKYIPHTE